MANNKNDAPEQIKLTPDAVKALEKRVRQSNLSKDDAKILLGLLSFTLWMQEKLARAKLSIRRLRKLFGFKTESRKKSRDAKDKDKAVDSSNATNANDPIIPANNEAASSDPVRETNYQETKNYLPPQWDNSKNHGRLSADDYIGCEDVAVNFTDELLLAGKCPDCAQCETNSNVYVLAPSTIVLLEGKPLVCGTRYHLQRKRCGVCQQYFTAPLPDAVSGKSKYAPSAKTNLAISHYYAGLPFKRIEMIQAANQVPLPDATQFALMEELYESAVRPITEVLRLYAANGETFYFDDTAACILEQIRLNKLASTAKDKKAVHGTAIFSIYQGHRIYLFDTNTRVAGKSIQSLLDKRSVDTSFTTMSDASASNFPTLEDDLAARWVISLCISHGRRRFVELLGEGDEDIQFILKIIGQVYAHEHYCKLHQFSPDARLFYHQKHSGPLIEALRIWLNNLLLYQQVEPNSRLGEAISYMLKRWFWLTQFLRVAGAPLDNNLCEQAIKVMLRYRKNSLFYRTFYGANIGDAMMSVMHTAVHAGANLFHYFNMLQHYADSVEASPKLWLPWNYQETMANLARLSKQQIA